MRWSGRGGRDRVREGCAGQVGGGWKGRGVGDGADQGEMGGRVVGSEAHDRARSDPERWEGEGDML